MALPKDKFSNQGHVFFREEGSTEFKEMGGIKPFDNMVFAQGELVELGKIVMTALETSVPCTVKNLEYSQNFLDFWAMDKKYFPTVKMIFKFTPTKLMRVKAFFIRMLKRKIL